MFRPYLNSSVSLTQKAQAKLLEQLVLITSKSGTLMHKLVVVVENEFAAAAIAKYGGIHNWA